MTELHYKGCNFFRQRLVLSLFSGRTVRITDIRPLDDEPGLRSFETAFIRLLDELTNGTQTEINDTGTELLFSPGFIIGGAVTFDCGLVRGISYFLEPLIYLAPFCKHQLSATLTGVTDLPSEPSVDCLKAAWLPLMKKFILDDEDLDIKIERRGLLPGGGGKVRFRAPICRKLRPLKGAEKLGKVRRIRGVAYACKVSPLMTNRMIDSAKQTLKGLLSDVYIASDHRKGEAGGNSPGFGICLYGETTVGISYCGEAVSMPKGSGEISTPEEVGAVAAGRLLECVHIGGCCDATAQSLTALYMALSPQDVSVLLAGELTTYSVEMLRHIRDFLGVVFKIESIAPPSEKSETVEGENDEDDMPRLGGPKLKLTCVGSGYSNLSKMVL